jgi:hypothetical protein
MNPICYHFTSNHIQRLQLVSLITKKEILIKNYMFCLYFNL